MNAMIAKLTGAIAARQAERRLRVLEVQAIGVGARLAVVEFGGRTLLLSIARDGARLVAEG